MMVLINLAKNALQSKLDVRLGFNPPIAILQLHVAIRSSHYTKSSHTDSTANGFP